MTGPGVNSVTVNAKSVLNVTVTFNKLEPSSSRRAESFADLEMWVKGSKAELHRWISLLIFRAMQD